MTGICHLVERNLGGLLLFLSLGDILGKWILVPP
jgi:hypothetical protein